MVNAIYFKGEITVIVLVVLILLSIIFVVGYWIWGIVYAITGIDYFEQ